MHGKLNCWEAKQCGREPNGRRIDRGVCPAALETRLQGIHDGTNAGRACWVVAGTLCRGCVQGTFALKLDMCERCDFYNLVVLEEGSEFTPPDNLLNKLK